MLSEIADPRRSHSYLRLWRTSEMGWMSTSRRIYAPDALSELIEHIRFDYIARDTHAIDMKVNLSLTRYEFASIMFHTY